MELMADEFERAGFKNIIRCLNGERGLGQIKEERPDLILLDILLPGMNGLELLKRKNEDPNIAFIPVIVISNLGSKSEVDQAIKLGAKDYIVKAQFSPKEVVKKANNFLNENKK